MNTLSIRLRYRPVRIGWCVRRGDFEALRNAVRLSYVLWGGRYNPIIPIDDTLVAESLVQRFRVDVLWPISKGEELAAFIKRFPHLPNPFHHEDVFARYSDGTNHPQLVDIYHPIQRCYEENFRNNPKPDLSVGIYEWQKSDHLADVLLITYGGFPSADATGMDYVDFLRSYLSAKTLTLSIDQPVPQRPDTEIALSWFSLTCSPEIVRC